MQAIDIRQLSFSGKAAIWWSLAWRGIVMTLCSAVVAGLLGGLFMVASESLLPATGDAPAAIRTVAGLVGGLLGVGSGSFFLYLYFRWLLSSRLGKYRLLLVNA